MVINDELLDELMKDYENPEGLLGEGAILKELTHWLLERALEGEMTGHWGCQKHVKSPNNKAITETVTAKRNLKVTLASSISKRLEIA